MTAMPPTVIWGPTHTTAQGIEVASGVSNAQYLQQLTPKQRAKWDTETNAYRLEQQARYAKRRLL